jgi:glutaredoxin-related protein
MLKKIIIVGIVLAIIGAYTYSVLSKNDSSEKSALVWYKIKALEGEVTYTYTGSSILSEKKFLDKLRDETFVTLDNLIYMDEAGNVKSFSDWDPTIKPRVYLNTEYVIAVVPLAGDPRK